MEGEKRKKHETDAAALGLRAMIAGQARLRFNGDAALVSAMLPETFLLDPAQQEVHVGREGPLSLSLFATLS